MGKEDRAVERIPIGRMRTPSCLQMARKRMCWKPPAQGIGLGSA